ncbi:MAG: rhodanese-like domain-containing protein [Nibricoccus sp.]
MIDAPGHLLAVDEAIRLRESRRISEDEFIRLAAEPDTVVLDARSAEMFERLHVRGAVNLSFPNFTAETLAAVIPTKTTRVLIYCNNNFLNSASAFPAKTISVALNLSTFTNLHAYGYTNVYELGPLLNINTTQLKLDGLEKKRKVR